MHKVVFAAALAVGLITAPISQFVSSAAAQQANAEKNAKTKKEPSAGQLATRERQKKCGAEWKEARLLQALQNFGQVENRERNASQVRRQLTLLQRAHTEACA